MKKRLKKKIQDRHNVLTETKRNMKKRKGIRGITYDFLPIGEKDKNLMNSDEVTPNYPYATHWLVDVYHWKKNNNHFQIRIFPCSKNGGSPTDSPVQMINYSDGTIEEVLNTFQKVVEDMKHDRFWDTIY